jgi:formylglycine-generating enzyme required for sulfatase activity
MWLDHFPANPSEAWDCGYDCPVENVSWWDAVAYANSVSTAASLPECYALLDCNGLPAGNGLNCMGFEILTPSGSPLDCEGFRLPTEAEWEWSARAGSVGDTYGGPTDTFDCDDLAHQMEIAWFDCNASSGPRPVGGRRPNIFGIYDTAGNVMEWVGDYWASEFEESELVDPFGPEFADERTIKGGSWNERAPRLRAGARLSGLPRLRTPFIGFRLAQSVLE